MGQGLGNPRLMHGDIASATAKVPRYLGPDVCPKRRRDARKNMGQLEREK